MAAVGQGSIWDSTIRSKGRSSSIPFDAQKNTHVCRHALALQLSSGPIGPPHALALQLSSGPIGPPHAIIIRSEVSTHCAHSCSYRIEIRDMYHGLLSSCLEKSAPPECTFCQLAPVGFGIAEAVLKPRKPLCACKESIRKLDASLQPKSLLAWSRRLL